MAILSLKQSSTNGKESSFEFDNFQEYPPSQSDTARESDKNWKIAVEHWRQRFTEDFNDEDDLVPDDDFDYKHVPFENLGKIRVRIVKVNTLKPRRLDEEADFLDD